MEMIVVAEDDKKFSEWHGIPRKEIKWYPTVDESRCIGCGMCFVGCGRKVYDYDFKKRKPIVARPFNCMVGCTTCAVTCPANAILFPDKEYVKQLIREKGVLVKVREKLEELKKEK